MFELVIAMFLGIMVGVTVGLLPALPIYFGPFLLYFFMGWSPESMLVFWGMVLIGSQYLGSVATIGMGLPGEASSLIYLDQVKRLSVSDRGALIRSTAQGSTIAGMIALAVLWILMTQVFHDFVSHLMSIKVQIVLYAVVLALLFIYNRWWATVLLIFMGIMLGPRNNYVLPEQWYHFTLWFQDTTFFMVVLGTMLIPAVLERSGQPKEILDVPKTAVDWPPIIKGTGIGLVSGLIPGPTAEMASMLAYRTQKILKDKIISAESANNAAIVVLLMPLLLIGMPITASSLIFSNIMDQKTIWLPEYIFGGSLIPGLRVIDTVILLLLAGTAIFYWLSVRGLKFYAKLISLVNRTPLILIALMVVMALLDIWQGEIPIIKYLGLLTVFTVFGFVLKRYHVNPIPFIFCMILGDKIVWLAIQSYLIYF